MPKVRILSVVHLDGEKYQPNQVVDLPAAIAKSFAEQGQVDTHKDAVAYCINELGAEVVVHPAPKVVKDTAAIKAAAALKADDIADLQARIDAADPADKPALEAELAALTAE